MPVRKTKKEQKEEVIESVSPVADVPVEPVIAAVAEVAPKEDIVESTSVAEPTITSVTEIPVSVAPQTSVPTTSRGSYPSRPMNRGTQSRMGTTTRRPMSSRTTMPSAGDNISAPSYTSNILSGNSNNNNGSSQGYVPNGNSYSNNNYIPKEYTQNESAYYTGDVIAIKGMLEILPDYGVIRQDVHPYDNPDLPKDVYISQSQIRRFNLRMGDSISGFARPPKEGERYLSLLRVEKVEGIDPEEARKRPQFTKLTPIFPNQWLKLETTQEIVSTRLIDLVAPIGRGQRAMVVSPPKAGKTWLLKDIANGLTTNYPEIVLLVALIGERPEEVTHFSRSVKGEVYASNFDEKAEDQTRVSEMCLERAKRLAEVGKDVVILMDSITRLARAYNMVAPPSGRTLTGGFDPAALYPAKHFFGAARNFEEGGSLTIIATALVDTGSRMDDVIFEEFKGTGNMELRLDRTLYERRIFPTIDIKSSGTRHEEYLMSKDEMDKVFRLRRMVDLLDDRESTELVIDRLKKSKSNKEFLDNLHKAA